ncbi:hypothetical protein Bca52824_094594 [Brassica carinata]|uniref:DUF630 domain-containing protein n=1 Tax=Brassica carinata TaxID=52824 RepID=A0A8X7P3S0_BRACI|nr:hypothetical protein Bca52824_094594 [Brassica carinata]
MGCAQSRVDNEESVARCKDRRNLIKEAVTASKAFAAGHFAYAIALKNTGAALSDYGHGESDQTLEVLEQQSHFQKQSELAADHPAGAPQPPPRPPPIENLPPPPPPLPKFSPSPIKRAISLPSMAVRGGRKVKGVDDMAIEEEDEEEDDEDEEEVGVKEEEEGESSPRTPENVGKGSRKRPETPEIVVSASPASSMAWDYFFMVENVPGPNLEEDKEVGNGFQARKNQHFGFSEEESAGHMAVEEMEPKTPEKVEEEEEDVMVVADAEKKEKGKAKIEHSNTAPPEFRRAVAANTTAAAPSVNLMKILDEIDDRFLKASECAQEVSKMLEATRLHYHSNFADNRGIEVIYLYCFLAFFSESD